MKLVLAKLILMTLFLMNLFAEYILVSITRQQSNYQPTSTSVPSQDGLPGGKNLHPLHKEALGACLYDPLSKAD